MRFHFTFLFLETIYKYKTSVVGVSSLKKRIGIMLNCLYRLEALNILALEELDYRKGQLAKLVAIHAPKSVIENEIRLVQRAKRVCKALKGK